MLPQKVLDNFARIPADTTNANDYNGAYNSLVYYAFFPTLSEPRLICPFCPLNEDDPATERATFVAFTKKRQPLFVLQVHPPGYINLLSTRIAADKKMRKILRSLFPETAMPKLHGVSAMGQKLAFYYMDTINGCILPENVPTAGDGEEVDTVPANRWEFDITTEAGHQQFMRAVNDAISMERNCDSWLKWLNEALCITQ
ncbi:hypothetical protein BD769DRAFT_1488425 [Suillus cothurnatus]|nr:hypothetical protein BD769DRAFT_1488425 [Suillus cothurnatus]